MRYLCNHLIDFDEIYVAMHICCSDPIDEQKFDNLKMWKSKIVDRGHLKIEKVISRISNFDKVFHDGVDLASRP